LGRIWESEGRGGSGRGGAHVVEDVVVVDVGGLAAEDHARAAADGGLRAIAARGGLGGPPGLGTPLRGALSSRRMRATMSK